MKKALLTTLIILAVSIAGTSAEAAFTNIGFETGDLTGWTTSGVGGSQSVLTGTVGDGYGTKYVQLVDGLQNSWISVIQTAYLDAGDTLDGAAKFQYNDWGSYYPDDAIVTIYDHTGATTTTPYYQATSSTGWLYWQYVAPVSGNYTLTYATANRGDSSVSSYAYFDTKQTASAVPEPATMVLLGTGLMGLAGLKRKHGTGLSA